MRHKTSEKNLSKEEIKINRSIDSINTINVNKFLKVKGKKIIHSHNTDFNLSRKLQSNLQIKQKRSNQNSKFSTEKMHKNGKNIQNSIKNKNQLQHDLLNEKRSKLLRLKQNIEDNIHRNKVTEKNTTLRGKLMERLKAAHFRLINEHIYTNKGDDAEAYFKMNKDDFKVYHEGFRQQASKWPINPLDVIIKAVKNM